MNRAAALLVSLLCAVPAIAQTAAQPADALPPLISDLTVRANDSKLVAAAKATVRSRTGLAAAGRRGVVIDNAYIRRSTGTISQSTATFTALPTFGSDAPAAQQQASGSENTVDRAAVQRKIEQLKVEQGRMAEEHDQPYGTFEDEDRAAMRLEHIPTQVETLQKQATPQPPQ